MSYKDLVGAGQMYVLAKVMCGLKRHMWDTKIMCGLDTHKRSRNKFICGLKRLMCGD